MQHIRPNRNWKYVHHARKLSNQSMDASFQSSHSNSSLRFNKFRFNRGDDSIISKPQQQVLAFTSKAKNKLHDISVLSKRSNKGSERSKISDGQIVPAQGKNTNIVAARKQKDKSSDVKALLKQVKFLTHNFKKVIEYFSRKIKELQIQWDSSFRQLLTQQVLIQHQKMNSVKQSMQAHKKKLQQLAQIQQDKQILKNDVLEKKHQRISNIAQVDILPFKLAMSKIEAPNDTAEISNKINRSATLMSLLSQDFNLPQPSVDRGGREMRSLRQTIKRMREVLQDQ